MSSETETIFIFKGSKLRLFNQYLNPYYGLFYYQYRDEHGRIIDLPCNLRLPRHFEKIKLDGSFCRI